MKRHTAQSALSASSSNLKKFKFNENTIFCLIDEEGKDQMVEVDQESIDFEVESLILVKSSDVSIVDYDKRGDIRIKPDYATLEKTTGYRMAISLGAFVLLVNVSPKYLSETIAKVDEDPQQISNVQLIMAKQKGDVRQIAYWKSHNDKKLVMFTLKRVGLEDAYKWVSLSLLTDK